MAGHVDDALDALQRQLRQHFGGAGARRVDQQLVEARSHPGLGGQVLGQVGGMELDVGQAVALRRSRARARPGRHRPRRRPRWPARRASGRVKLPRPQNRSSTRSAGCGIEQLQRARDHLLVQAGVDLDEVERTERQAQVELRDRETAARPLRPQRTHRLARRPAAGSTAKPLARAKSRRRARSASPSGSRWRNTSATGPSPAMNSICGIVRLPSSDSTSAASSGDALAEFRQRSCGIR